MKNNKKKALVSAILTIALCLSVIAGATFALFTSNDEVNIAVTSGKVSLTAIINEDSLALSSLGVAQEDNFAAGGTATLSAESLTLTNIVPGDKATFDIDVTNDSNVDIMYKLAWNVNNDALDALVATATIADEELTTTDWTVWYTPENDAEKSKTIAVEIELPMNAGNDYQDKTATISFTVEAVQANAVVEEVITEDQIRAAISVGIDTIALAGDIVLTAPLNIPQGRNIVIVLNGNTIESANGESIVNDGSLTIVDSMSALMTLSDEEPSVGTVSSAIVNNGEMTVNSGSIAGSITNAGEMTFNGGALLGAIENTGEGALTINDGIIEGQITGENIAVLGGDFKNDPSEFVQEAYFNITKNENDIWEVGVKDNVVLIETAEQLLSYSETKFPNNGKDTLVLVNDIDMEGALFKAMIVARSSTFNFDGNNNTISNVNFVSGNDDNSTGQASMFYTYSGSTLNVSNLVIKNANSASDNDAVSGYGAIVVGYCEGTANVTNVDIIDSTVVGAKSSGIFVGHLSGAASFADCEITNGKVIIREDTVEANGHYAGKLVGTIAGAFDVSNVTYDVAVSGKLHVKNVGDMFGRFVSGTINGAKLVTASEFDTFVANGGSAMLTEDVQLNRAITKDLSIDLNGKTMDVTYSYNLSNGADLTVKNGTYETNKSYGHIDVRPSEGQESVVVFENVHFLNNYKGRTTGTSTTRVISVLEFYSQGNGGKVTVLFKDCTFDNARVVFEGSSSYTGEFDVTFDNCTFNALTNSSLISVDAYPSGTINIENCTFNLTCTTSNIKTIEIRNSKTNAITLIATNNTLNAVAATAYTYNSALGETVVDTIKVDGTPRNIRFAAYNGNVNYPEYNNTTATITGLTVTGIAIAN